MSVMPRFSFDQWVTRVINPVGFVAVVLAFLFLPCASVSVTEWPSMVLRDNSIFVLRDNSFFKAVTDDSVTGGNIAFRDGPPHQSAHRSGYGWSVELRMGTIVTVLVMAAGAGTGLVRPAERRLRHAAQVAAVAGVFLALAVLSAAGRMEDNTYGLLANEFGQRGEEEFHYAAGPETGFWVSLTGLALIFAINLFALRALRRRG
ncbi:hypothetical protein [Actinomadura sp. 9N215]|uniref:hypothetical protein n=1 Tax=Actinomadura sp. 9N215 TaxID=3375150 RepID=UPI003797A87D